MHTRFRSGRVAALVAAVTLARAVPAQPTADTLAIPAHAARHGPAHRDVATLGAFAAATLVALPFDATITEAVRDPGPQRSHLLHQGAHAFNLAGDPGALVTGVALLAIGRVAGAHGTASLGLHATEAVVVAGTITAAAKLLSGRQRPNVEAGDADDFTPGRGYRPGRTSFPSGHTTVAFAFASSVATELRARHARGARVIGPMLYGAAALVGAARVYDDKHWTSDVVLGAGIGTVTGHATAMLGRRHAPRWLDGLAGRSADAR